VRLSIPQKPVPVAIGGRKLCRTDELKFTWEKAAKVEEKLTVVNNDNNNDRLMAFDPGQPG